MYIFFDTETTGLPRDVNLTPDNYPGLSREAFILNFPRIVQLSWLIYDSNQIIIESKDYVIKPDNYIIPERMTEIHGISTEKAKQVGHSLNHVLNQFKKAANKCDYMICHNFNFDMNMIKSEFARLKKNYSFFNKCKHICTMHSTTDLLKIPTHKYEGYKYPKLSELYSFLFDKTFDNAHNAYFDVKATADCFFRLQELKKISV